MTDHDQTGAIVRLDDGTVAVGVRPDESPTIQLITALGAVFLIDAESPSGLAYGEIHDVAQAAWWLDLVYGDENAATIADAARGEGPVSRDVDQGTWQSAPMRTHLARLARGLWVQRWFPSAGTGARVVDEALLDLEVGVLAWSCEHVLGGLSLAETSLGGRVDDLRALATDLGHPAGPGLVLPALRAVLEVVVLDDDVAGALQSAEQQWLGVEVSVAEAGGVWERRLPDWLTATRPEVGAGSRGVSGTTGQQRADVDWTVLAPRVVAGDTVEWTVDSTSDGTFVSVGVDAGSRRPASDGEVPWATVHCEGAGLPVAVFELNLVQVGGTARWASTSAPFDASAGEPRVRVFSPGHLARADADLGRRMREAGADLASRLSTEVTWPAAPPDDLVITPVHELDPTAPFRGLGAR